MTNAETITQKITDVISTIFLEQNGTPAPTFMPDTVLLESGIDSLGFALIVVNLEEELGYDPFTIADGAFYPRTYKEFVDFYITHAPADA